ncbi:hypothetical protein E2986_12939 [Frieseomelitta varia]|uniref:Uncharacterized protein n=1 Tax=Frieseomelitta varia TaxID=561572 RepID=A0A833RC61_9HYME|nr:hypothetical protein E2986_12939 [Frieseomelitta varia]
MPCFRVLILYVILPKFRLISQTDENLKRNRVSFKRYTGHPNYCDITEKREGDPTWKNKPFFSFEISLSRKLSLNGLSNSPNSMIMDIVHMKLYSSTYRYRKKYSSTELHVDALVGGKDLCVSESEGRQQQNCDIAPCVRNTCIRMSICLLYRCSTSPEIHILNP